MPLPTGDLIAIMADNLRLRKSVLPIPTRHATRWARGLNLPHGGQTVLYTGLMYQLIPFIERMVAVEERVGSSPLAKLTGLGRRMNRLVNLLGFLPSPAAGARAPYDQILVDIVRLLRAAGVEFGYLYADELYSGALAHDLGADEAVAVQAKRVDAVFRQHGVRNVITVDPHTTNMLRSVYPALVPGFDVTVHSYLEVLAAQQSASPAFGVGAGAGVPDAGAGLPDAGAPEVVLHDSCVFARYEQVVDQPRQLLRQAGVTVREPEQSGAFTWCCGGPIESLYPEKARANAVKRVAQLRAVAPDGVTMCPLCLVNLRRAAGDTMRFTDISHYLSRADVLDRVDVSGS